MAQPHMPSGRCHRAQPTPITCPPDFTLGPLLRRAAEEELAAPPDFYIPTAPAPSPPMNPDAQRVAPAEAPSNNAHPPPPPLLSKKRRLDPEPGSSPHPPSKGPRFSPSPHAPSCSGPSSRTLRLKARKPALRKKAKDQRAQKAREPPRAEIVKKYLERASSTTSQLKAASLLTKSSGYEAKAAGASAKKAWTTERLGREGFRKVAWDGRETLLLTESGTNKVFAVCVGRPKDASWEAACLDASATMRERAQLDAFVPKELSHKRGRFPAINAGILHGQGSKSAHNLSCHGHEETLQALLGSKSIQRVAAHQSESLKVYFPRLYDYYHLRQHGVLAHNTALRPNFTRSVFACSAFNIGEKVATYSHRDCMNCPFGQCAVTALGRYDHTKGGHLVLEEAKLYIEFPPGALILLPSATVTHANTPIQDGETRQSFTQYTPGGLFRFYDNGFRTESQLFEEDEEEYWRVMGQKGTRWEVGLGLWSTLDELGCKTALEK